MLAFAASLAEQPLPRMAKSRYQKFNSVLQFTINAGPKCIEAVVVAPPVLDNILASRSV